ncbi:MAG: hypothetical protein DRJ34_02485 [Thermoprotei archaeon]|nr:MAG: hypothetical protein DRJ34_02485 [Thermoprotei archaeon]
MVLIEYEARDTIIHRLNSLSKLIWFSGIIFLLTLYLEPQPLLILFIFELFIGYLAKIPWRKILARAWWAFIFSIASGYSISLWVNQPSQFTNVPKEFACKVLIQLTPEGTPLLGYTAITYGGLLWGTAATLKISIAVIAACILSFSTSISDIIFLWSRFLPYRLSFIITAGMRFYPVMVDKTQEIIIAAKSRGWEISSRNPVKRVKSLFPIVFPAIREAVVLAEKMALAVEARAFGVKKPTNLRQISFTYSDFFFILFNVFITGILTYMWWFYGFGRL